MRFHPARVHRGQSRPHLRWGRGRFGTDFIGRSFLFSSSLSFVMIFLSLSLRPTTTSWVVRVLLFLFRQFLISFSWPLIERHYFVAGLFRFKWHSKRCNHCQRNCLFGPTNPNALLSLSSSSLYYNHFKYLRTGFFLLVFFFLIWRPLDRHDFFIGLISIIVQGEEMSFFEGFKAKLFTIFSTRLNSMSRQVNRRKKR